MSEICQSAQIPFVLFTFIGADEDRDKIKESNPFYVGAIDADMVTDGKLIAASAYEDGCRKAVLVGGNIGDNNVDQRMQGFTEEFEALGGTVLVEVRCTDASECPVKAEDTLSAYRDADCLYAIAGDYIPGSLSAINNLGMTDQMKVYMSCVDENSAIILKKVWLLKATTASVWPRPLHPLCSSTIWTVIRFLMKTVNLRT
jgi:ABC-type sugar transport system substrate-binding protein